MKKTRLSRLLRMRHGVRLKWGCWRSRRGFGGKRRPPQQPRKTRNFRRKQRVRASGRITEFCYNDGFGAVPKRPKGEVCKTSIRGFESHPRLQSFQALTHKPLH